MSKRKEAPYGQATQEYFEDMPGDPYWVGRAVGIAVTEFAHKAKTGENYFFGQEKVKAQYEKIPNLLGRDLVVQIDQDGSVYVRELHDLELDGG